MSSRAVSSSSFFGPDPGVDVGSAPVWGVKCDQDQESVDDDRVARGPLVTLPVSRHSCDYGSCASSTPERERECCQECIGLWSMVYTVSGVILPLMSSVVLLSSVASVCHGQKPLALELLTVYGYGVTAAIAVTLFKGLFQGCKEDCAQDCEQKSHVYVQSIERFGHIEGVFVNTITGPLALIYVLFRLLKSDTVMSDESTANAV